MTPLDDEEPLTPAEREALRALPREMPVPAPLADQTVRRLRDGGRLPAQHKRGRGRTVLAIAAAVILAIGGYGVGRLTQAPAPTAPDTSAVARGQRFALLLYGAASGAGEESARVREYGAWAASEGAAGRMLSGHRLGPATHQLGPGVLPASGATNDQPNGFFIIRAATPEDAAAIAGRCPHLRHGGTVVVRPLD